MKLLDWFKMTEAKGPDSPAKIIRDVQEAVHQLAAPPMPQEPRLKISDLSDEETRKALVEAGVSRDIEPFTMWYERETPRGYRSFTGYYSGARDGWLACLAAIRSGEVKP